jgi:hypothetical protein
MTANYCARQQEPRRLNVATKMTQPLLTLRPACARASRNISFSVRLYYLFIDKELHPDFDDINLLVKACRINMSLSRLKLAI